MDNTQGIQGTNPEADQLENTKPIDEMKIVVPTETIGKVAAIGMIVIMVGTIVPCLLILRIQPKVLFTQKD